MAHGFSQAVIAEAIRNADPAAQISDGLVVHLAAELQPLFSTRVAAYGRETCAQELLPLPRSCSACKTRLAECRGSATPAAVIDLCGVVEKLHVPLRCRKPSCPEFGVLLWYNYCVRKGKHVFQGELPLLQCFMLSSSFGFSIPWLRQFHLRLVRQHASFTSEADVLTAQAATNSQLHRLPTSRLRLLISQGWFTWRLLTRGLEAGLDLSVVDFQSPMEDTACRFLGPLQAAFSRKAVEGAQRAKMRCDVIVLDGNAKNRRAVCAAALAGCSYSPTLRRTLRHTCTKTPAFKHSFCLHHCEAPGADRSHTDVEILQHKSINDGQQLMVLLQETTEPRREAWVLDSAVPDTVLSKYLRQVGAEKLKLRKRTHDPQPSDTAGPSPAPPLLQAQVEPVAELEQCSDPADLASVACSTHKESSTAQRQLAKSAGMLCVCLSEGLILHMQEIYGCESLSQRYFCVAAVKALLPTLTTVVHDDACHLHKYCARRAAHSQAAAQLSPPHMTFVCDKFHMAGHTDAWCKQTCDPELPSNSALLAGVRTSVCEFTFTWLSKYKHQTKHMNEYGFQFFLLDMAWSHNEIILQGGYRPEEVAGSLDAEDVA
ncbi:unnamed protein product [Cladocopium goreaui]|uniref:Uncharacterized protein n=1 Tax=Cladocopium goreaui TaxID=2562237 RepID=A0A9P1C8L5_9DINO|nr:unnamed protein product [Cladocopium goreaui]